MKNLITDSNFYIILCLSKLTLSCVKELCQGNSFASVLLRFFKFNLCSASNKMPIMEE